MLSDPSKRQMYDQTGNTGEGNAAGYNQGGFNPEDIFGQFKGGFGGRTGGFDDIFKDLFGRGFNPEAAERAEY